MDRLYVVIALIALTGACDGDKKATADAPKKSKSRVNAVVAKKQVAEAPEDFCDVYHPDAEGAPSFEFPPITTDSPQPAKGWRWVNIWATWCKPCVEEMPRLQTWETDLSALGLADVVFVSADDTEDAVTAFSKEHPELPTGVRMSSPDDLQPWLNGLGLAGSPSLPVHLFVDAEGTTRCIRMGGVSDLDRGAVERVLTGG